jgi:hypothetical protein
MSMPKVTLAGGVVLILLSIVGVVGAIQHGKSPMTALIPFFFGDLLVVFGFLSMKNEKLRKHLMHAAATVALLAVLAAAFPIAIRGSQLSLLSLICIGGMLLTGLVLEILYVRSFIAARKARELGATPTA